MFAATDSFHVYAGALSICLCDSSGVSKRRGVEGGVGHINTNMRLRYTWCSQTTAEVNDNLKVT